MIMTWVSLDTQVMIQNVIGGQGCSAAGHGTREILGP